MCRISSSLKAAIKIVATQTDATVFLVWKIAKPDYNVHLLCQHRQQGVTVEQLKQLNYKFF